MDVDAASYPKQLLAILDAISHAEFVAIDLEMSGIPSRMPRTEKPSGARRKTLKDLYEECKAAADRYSILQIGITCARFEWLLNKYVLTPYNIILSPVMDEHLGLEREICIQTGAASFLLNHGFDWGAAFAKGVQYLSREEATRTKRIAYARIDKKNDIEDVQLKAEDIQSLDFMRRVREAIVAWKIKKSEFLEITTDTGLEGPPREPTISRFEKRLVHQLIRAEFPELQAFGKSDSFCIRNHNPIREAQFSKRQKGRIKEQIAKQTGFRWIFEALAQGDISDLDPLRSGHLNIIPASDPAIKDRFDLIHDRLIRKQPVLVGHNMFTDLTYFYRTFVGPLPDTLEEFCTAIHRLFPRIVDTKYLATHAEGDLNNSPPLANIASKLADQPLPDIALEANHLKYLDKEAYHEAGFDSMVTAKVMLRLAAKIHHEQQRDQPPSNDSTPISKTEPEAPSKPPPVSSPQTAAVASRPKLKPKSRLRTSGSRFQSQNVFDALSSPTSPETDTPSSPSAAEEKLIDPDEPSWGKETPDWAKEPYVPPASSNRYEVPTMKRKPMEIIPPFEDKAFWGVFGNVLRVFGTEEKVLRVADW